VIFTKDLQRLIGWRRSFMIESLHTFLAGYHGDKLGNSNGFLKWAAVCWLKIKPTLWSTDIRFFHTAGKSHRRL
jgi:hypothetical protein